MIISKPINRYAINGRYFFISSLINRPDNKFGAINRPLQFFFLIIFIDMLSAFLKNQK